MESAGFTKNDLAKYPFLKETAEYIKPLDLQIGDLTSIGMDQLLKRAEERVNEAIINRIVNRNLKKIDLEILSFPVALLIVITTENSFIKKRYALAEAKQASSDLAKEPKERILKIARDFDWKIKLSPKEDGDSPLEFTIKFTDYLRNAAHFHDKKWKLTNSILSHGNIFLNRKDVVRLLEEEVRRRIEKRLDVKLPKYPPELIVVAERVKKLASEVIGQMEIDELPKVVVQTAFPPCINALYEAASSSHHLSHIGRFTLTSFLVNIGMSSEKVNELFKGFSDYNERLTLYQIEHIAGERGSGTRYTPPQCSVLQTHGVCKNKDDLCRRIYHPLAYYKRKQKLA
ncbi:MAG: DNA primase large subunit PriL [Candidatus Bathyarchaeia archaeon]|jgi:DNA primase large subunit